MAKNQDNRVLARNGAPQSDRAGAQGGECRVQHGRLHREPATSSYP